jgi:hypothetical protein
MKRDESKQLTPAEVKRLINKMEKKNKKKKAAINKKTEEYRTAAIKELEKIKKK